MKKKQPYTKPITINSPLFIATLPITLLSFSQPLLAATALSDDPQFQRGKKTFERYCAKCDGKKANGEGRMTKLYRRKREQLPTNFTTGTYIDRPEDYLRMIITDGGEKHSMSKYMPPFGEEINHAGVDDLIHFIKRTPELHGFNGDTKPNDNP